MLCFLGLYAFRILSVSKKRVFANQRPLNGGLCLYMYAEALSKKTPIYMVRLTSDSNKSKNRYCSSLQKPTTPPFFAQSVNSMAIGMLQLEYNSIIFSDILLVVFIHQICRRSKLKWNSNLSKNLVKKSCWPGKRIVLFDQYQSTKICMSVNLASIDLIFTYFIGVFSPRPLHMFGYVCLFGSFFFFSRRYWK